MPSFATRARRRHRANLLEIFRAALARVDGRRAVSRHLRALPPPPALSLVAIGKAAGSMALGAMDAWGTAVVDGLVVSKPGHLDGPALRARGLECLEGGHPLPDPGSLGAGRRLLEWLGGLPPSRELLFLISGGASSLLEVPAGGLGLAELQQATRWLLASGLDIAQVNRVRKALSRVKAGGLLPHLGRHPARALLISDVPGDDPAVIGSGLLVPDPGLGEVAALDLPPWLTAPVAAGLSERAAAPACAAPPLKILARLDDAMAAAAERARELGYAVRAHRELLDGDAAEAGAALVRTLTTQGPALHVWGGETTVRLPSHPGRGGRSQHLALAAALAMRGREDLLLLAAGTDGSDGPTEDAGALVDGCTLGQAATDGLDGADYLARADSGALLEAAGALIHTGPTGTNVMDLVLGLRWTEDGAG